MASQLYAWHGTTPLGLSPVTAVALADAARLSFPELAPAVLRGLAGQVLRQYRALGPDLIWGVEGVGLPQYGGSVKCTAAARTWAMRKDASGWVISLPMGPEVWRLRLEAAVTGRWETELERLRQTGPKGVRVEIYESPRSWRPRAGKPATRLMIRFVAAGVRAGLPGDASLAVPDSRTA